MQDLVSKAVELAVGQGLWAVLYLYLFFRMWKEDKDREDRYQATIDRLATNIEAGIIKISTQLDTMAEHPSDDDS